MQDQGVMLKPFTYRYDVNAEDAIMSIMISEAAAHFDYWQRSGQDDQNRRQDYWPPLLRLARLIPAVEYIQVNPRDLTLQEDFAPRLYRLIAHSNDLFNPFQKDASTQLC